MQKRDHNHTMQKVRDLLAVEIDISYQDVADKCHIDIRNAREYMNILHAADEVHIVGYLPYSIPIFRKGAGLDAKKKNRHQMDCIRVKQYRQKRNAKQTFVSAAKAPSITAFLLGI